MSQTMCCLFHCTPTSKAQLCNNN